MSLEDIKYRDLPDYIKEHLSFMFTLTIRAHVLILMLVLDFLVIVPLLYPVTPRLLYFLVPLLLFINGWSIRLLIVNPYSTQFEFIRYAACYGTISSIVFFSLSQKISVYMLGLETNTLYYVLTTFLYLLSFIMFGVYQFWKYSRIRTGFKASSLYVGGVASVGPGLGYIFSRSIHQYEKLSNIVAVLCFYFLAVFWGFVGAKFIHKYLFMKKNKHLITYEKPPKSHYKRKLVSRDLKIK